MKRWKIGCLVIVAVVVCIAVIIAGVYLFGLWRMDKAERVIGNYLQKKYHREFVIDEAKYTWATKGYSFLVHAKDDPGLKFPAFVGFNLYENGIGDMYGVARTGREAVNLVAPFADAISKNNFCGANFDSGYTDKEPYPIMKDIRRNNLSPLQAASKYPNKIYIGIGISYALDITDKNKEEIFKKVFNLIEFLKDKKFGYIEMRITFYPPSIFNGKTVKQAHDENLGTFVGRYKPSAFIIVYSKDIIYIKTYKNMQNYFHKYRSYEEIINSNSNSETRNGGTK